MPKHVKPTIEELNEKEEQLNEELEELSKEHEAGEAIKPETEEERIVLDVVKAGADNYETLVEFLETEGDMSEIETLMTLKQLCLKLPDRPPKFAIWYPCYYFLFNSRSVPQINTGLKVGD